MIAPKKVDERQRTMTEVFRELARVLRSGGHMAFEVGEDRNGKVKLEEAVARCHHYMSAAHGEKSRVGDLLHLRPR